MAPGAYWTTLLPEVAIHAPVTQPVGDEAHQTINAPSVATQCSLV